MAIFQNSVIKHHKQDEKLLATRWANFQEFKAKVEAIKDFKEEEYQDGFLRDVFELSLGYTLKSTDPANFSLIREYKNETDSKKADAVIVVADQVVGVVELKDQKTQNLERVTSQAFEYHRKHSSSKYIIISNFDEIRFYIDKETAYEKFNLFRLTYDDFIRLHLILSFESISEDIPLILKEKSNLFEQNISKELYRDFSQFRLNLFENIVKNNHGGGASAPQNAIDKSTQFVITRSEATKQSIDKSTLLRLTQKLCDRIVFILFAEDRGLLKTNTIKEIREEFRNQKFTDHSLYGIYKFYFDGINRGNEKLSIPSYNGGLFAPDPLLDSLIIDDEMLDSKAQKLSNYDFASEISVNILGHIFEQSLTDLEELQADIENIEFDSTRSKRKKDGVFYTPEYITRYIVQNTLGKLCDAKRAELDILEVGLQPRKKKENLLAYKEWLFGLKILDPACGSGAFLNQALEFLIAEHKKLQDELATIGDLFASYTVEESVLEHNLYGVDINEDAVEIAKLSLWIRTAQKGRVLTKLSEKIVCANSLLDMPFEMGSFDVVIGNPPYVRQEAIDNELKEKYLLNHKEVGTSTADLYVYFFETSIRLLKENGLLGLITPNKWMERKYAEKLREYLISFDIKTIINFGELRIFEDASTEPAIIILENSKTQNDIEYLMVKNLDEAQSLNYNTTLYKKETLASEIWKFVDPIIASVLNKFNTQETTLEQYTNGGVYRGILTGLNEAFIVNNETYQKIIQQDSNSKQLLKKMVEGDDFGKWHLRHSGRYMVATQYDLEIKDDFVGIYNHLENFREKLIKRQDKGKNYWNLRACDYYDKLEQPKLVYYHTALNHQFYFDTDGYYISANCYFISNPDRYLQCLLNSKLFDFVKKYLFPAFGDSEKGGRVRLDANKMNKIAIKLVDEEAKIYFEKLADQMLELNKKLQETKEAFLGELYLEKIPKKLQDFELLEFDQFVKEYAKAKKIKFADKLEERNFKNEWQRLFETDKQSVTTLQNQINTTDQEINQMVYKLYDLTDEEIEIIENA